MYRILCISIRFFQGYYSQVSQQITFWNQLQRGCCGNKLAEGFSTTKIKWRDRQTRQKATNLIWKIVQMLAMNIVSWGISFWFMPSNLATMIFPPQTNGKSWRPKIFNTDLPVVDRAGRPQGAQSGPAILRASGDSWRSTHKASLKWDSKPRSLKLNVLTYIYVKKHKASRLQPVHAGMDFPIICGNFVTTFLPRFWDAYIMKILDTKLHHVCSESSRLPRRPPFEYGMV